MDSRLAMVFTLHNATQESLHVPQALNLSKHVADGTALHVMGGEEAFVAKSRREKQKVIMSPQIAPITVNRPWIACYEWNFKNRVCLLKGTNGNDNWVTQYLSKVCRFNVDRWLHCILT